MAVSRKSRGNAYKFSFCLVLELSKQQSLSSKIQHRARIFAKTEIEMWKYCLPFPSTELIEEGTK